eukprot:9330690-Pyramimonas_sp.AAC.2
MLGYLGPSWGPSWALRGPPGAALCHRRRSNASPPPPPRSGRRGLEGEASYTTYALTGWWDGGRKCWPSWTPNSDVFGYGCICDVVQYMWPNAHDGGDANEHYAVPSRW